MAYSTYTARRVAPPAAYVHRTGYAGVSQRRSVSNYRPGGHNTAYGRPTLAHRFYGTGNVAGRYAHTPAYGARSARGYAARYTPGYGMRYGSRFAPGYAARYGAGTRWNWLRRGAGYGYAAPSVYMQQGGVDQAQPMPMQDQGAPQQGAPAPLPPQWIAWAQGCLAQTVGSWVPQNGIMAKATRHAIRTFQKQQQLPPTGMLDAATITALQTACSPQAAPASPAPPPPQAGTPAPPGGDDVAAATAAASGAPPEAPPPDGAPPADPGAGAPPDAPAGEFFMGRSRGGFRGSGFRGGGRRWGSGFNFLPDSQPYTGDDDSELFMGGRGRFHRRWGGGGGMGFQQQQQQDDGDNGDYQPPPPHHRWRM